jgi:hypothetical protein
MVYSQLNRLVVGLLLLFGLTPRSFGFALLGPYADWMQVTNGYHRPGDIGGPVDIGQGYRWNVPVVSYGFDQSFLDYFGSNGVAAVEGAITILNDLPPASAIVLTNFPLDAARYNYAAEAEGLFDVKSVALTLLLEQMGLASPTRNVFDLRKFDPILMSTDESTWPPGTIPNLVIERNFDPESLLPSHSVNGNNFTGKANFVYSNVWDVGEYAIDPMNDFYSSAVSDWRDAEWLYPFCQPGRSMLGVFFTGLTSDDAGGLRYLLSTNNIQLEVLLSDVHGTGTNAGAYVNLAKRPGVDKTTFVRQENDSALGQWVPITNQFTDSYIATNNVVMHQSVERVIVKPDILFSAEGFGVSLGMAPGYSRTGTSNWWNSATAIGGTNQTGSGVIRPQVKIAFGKRGPFVESVDDGTLVYDYEDFRWASFDGSVSPPIDYPEAATFAGADQLNIHLNLLGPASALPVAWQVPVAFGGTASLQTSTNLVNWESVITVTNYGGAVDWNYRYSRPQRFFRAVPQ